MASLPRALSRPYRNLSGAPVPKRISLRFGGGDGDLTSTGIPICGALGPSGWKGSCASTPIPVAATRWNGLEWRSPRRFGAARFWPRRRRLVSAHPIHDFGAEAGQLVVTASLRAVVVDTALIAAGRLRAGPSSAFSLRLILLQRLAMGDAGAAVEASGPIGQPGPICVARHDFHQPEQSQSSTSTPAGVRMFGGGPSELSSARQYGTESTPRLP